MPRLSYRQQSSTHPWYWKQKKYRNPSPENPILPLIPLCPPLWTPSVISLSLCRFLLLIPFCYISWMNKVSDWELWTGQFSHIVHICLKQFETNWGT